MLKDNIISDSPLVSSLRQAAADALRAALGGARRVALVDFPYNRNTGDAAIWCGELRLLADLEVEVGYVADAGRYDARRLASRVPDGPVLLSGGGNVGDLWLWPQGLRERVLRDFPGRPVIQLPQSIHFRDGGREREFAAAVRRHGAYVFLARDKQAYDLAQRLSPAGLMLVPDMAFGLGHVRRYRSARTPILALARDDVEESSGLRAMRGPGVAVRDWSLGQSGDLAWQARRLAPRALRAAHRDARAYRLAAPVTDFAMRSMARQVLRGGLDLLSTADVVVTDRLHGHLLCMLLDIPHVVLDNRYGKIRALHDAWTAASATTYWAETPAEALQTAYRLAGR
jgi:exopolysaccharide biosynthesis predicted pyruvyltransferase EpsI